MTGANQSRAVKEKGPRRSISKTVRFEVFKRDSFKCQYCGATAPQVLLHVDHIAAVAKGGTNELTNLVTSCESCNLGKSDKALADDSAVTKARNQMEELQARREQLEMMMQWKQGLRDLTSETVERVSCYWEAYTPGWSVSDSGRKKVEQWIKKFSLDEVTSAMDTAAVQYLKEDKNGKITTESWELAFAKIPGICRVERESKVDPDLKELYYIRGIVRNKCGYFRPAEALEWLQAARSWDISIDTLRRIALETRNWTHFVSCISGVIDNRKKEEGAG